MITQEVATVWRGGGRRWFSKQAACRAEARRMMRKRCECDAGDSVTPSYSCRYHSVDNYGRIINRLTRHLLYNLNLEGGK